MELKIKPSRCCSDLILPLFGDIQRHCISRLSFTISYANKVIKINRCLETCQYWGKACNAINIFPENMDNHTEILLNTFKSVAYDDNWALQHEKCAFKSTTQLKQKTVDLYFLMHCSSDFRIRRCPKMHFRPENNCSKEYACEVYIFKVWAEDWAGLLPSLNRDGVHISWTLVLTSGDYPISHRFNSESDLENPRTNI